jgi:hypothetical protein
LQLLHNTKGGTQWSTSSNDLSAAHLAAFLAAIKPRNLCDGGERERERKGKMDRLWNCKVLFSFKLSSPRTLFVPFCVCGSLAFLLVSVELEAASQMGIGPDLSAKMKNRFSVFLL